MNKKNKVLVTIILINIFFVNVYSQIGIGTTDPDDSSALDIVSTDSGVLIPRLTTIQRLDIGSPAIGLLVYDSDENVFFYYNGTNWISIPNNPVPDKISDADNDTIIQVEETPDDDIIRFDVSGIEVANIQRNSSGQARMEFFNPGSSVFIGTDSGLHSQSVSFFNCFVGTSSGENNSSGISNSFYGTNSGETNTTGNFNSYYGANAGINNNGSLNSFFGNSAGISVASGDNNVYIGYLAGEENISGDGNVFIGSGAGGQETGSDLLYIDNTNTTTPLIWGNFDMNRVGINRVATTNTLEVGGDASKSTPGSWLGNSDKRLKKNIKSLDATDMLNALLQLQGVTYEWKAKDRPSGTHYGFVAQNMEEVFPELVKVDQEGYLQTSYGTLDAMMVEALRELSNRNLQLEQENKDIKSRLDKLEQLVEASLDR